MCVADVTLVDLIFVESPQYKIGDRDVEGSWRPFVKIFLGALSFSFNQIIVVLAKIRGRAIILVKIYWISSGRNDQRFMCV